MKRLGMTHSVLLWGVSNAWRSVVLLVVLLGCGGPCPALGQTETQKPAAPAALLPAEIEVMQLVNEFRARHGLPRHRLNAALCRAARKHAENMARQDRMSHVLDGAGPTERALAEGFAGPVAENCAAGIQGTPRAFFDLWVASEAHRSNMLSPGVGEMGAGFASTGKENKVYCAAVFGAAL